MTSQMFNVFVIQLINWCPYLPLGKEWRHLSKLIQILWQIETVEKRKTWKSLQKAETRTIKSLYVKFSPFRFTHKTSES